MISRKWNSKGIDLSASLRRALEVCEAAFDDIVDKSADGVLIFNDRGTICFANAAAESMLGCSTGELLGEPFGIPVMPGETIEMDLPSADNERHVAEMRVVATQWQGTPALLGTIRDVTVRKEAEEKEHEALVRRDEFLAVLSHELRNPLAAISNAAAVLSRSDLNSKSFAKARNVIERQCGQMTRLLGDLLDVSRLTRRKFELQTECLDLLDIVAEAADAVRGQIDAAGQTLFIDAAEKPILVDGDAARLQQVLVNLLSNASKYSSAGDAIELFARIEDNEAVVRVRDQGHGLTPEMVPAIFEPFVQLDGSLDRSGQGLGLGLAIVDGLVELHGGTVQATSEGRGKGSQFTVRLPLSKSRPKVTPVSAVTSEAESLRLAIVEDNADVRTMLKALLEIAGYQVDAAEDGLEGVELIERIKPDVALIDIGLPKLNGYQLARRIRAADDCKDVYLVALTGYGQPADQAKAKDHGFDAHLAKPVNLEQIRELLAARRTSARL